MPPKMGVDKSKSAVENVSIINTMTCKFDAVRRVAARLGMKESMENWDIYWTDTSITVDRCKEMKRYQRINHFPGMFEICRKDQLARNLNRLQKLYPGEFLFFPKTWCLRSELSDVLEYAKTHKSDVYIIKPNIGCQGKGICITNNVSRLRRCDDMICQVYLQKPLLIDGYKFDLRVYVLITSCDPLRIFVYNEGLARFATAKYRRPDSFNAANQFMHLTNYSVNKHSQAYVVGDDGTKRRLSTINQWFINNNYDLKKIWNDIDDAIIKTVMAALPTVRHEYHVAFPHHGNSFACFEILGFDFIFDCQIRPYILEVNHSPSLQTDTEIDQEVKDSLLLDTFTILNLQSTNRLDILAEERRRAWERLFSAQGDILSRERARNEIIAKKKFGWENLHMGNFRKIYPSRKTTHYEQFLCSQSSLFAGTCSSRAKECTSPKFKTARFKIFRMLKMPESKSSGTKYVKVSKKPVPKRVIKPATSQDNKIDELEERERVMALRRRDSIVKSYGIFEKLFETFKNVGLLSKSDELKMREMGLELGDTGKPAKESLKVPSQTLESIARKIESIYTRISAHSLREKPIVSNQETFQPSVIDDTEESDRISSMERRGFLLESIGIHKIVHEYFKRSGLLKLEERAKPKPVISLRRRALPMPSQKDETHLMSKRLQKVQPWVRPVQRTIKSAGDLDQFRPARPLTKRESYGGTKRIDRVVTQLDSLIKLWKGRRRGSDSHRAAVREWTFEDSPEIWHTPPEECPEAMKIQPEFRLNPEVH